MASVFNNHRLMELAMDNDELDHFSLLANKRASCKDPICYKKVSRPGMLNELAGPESTNLLSQLANVVPNGQPVRERFGNVAESGNTSRTVLTLTHRLHIP
jgi:hypothetical protein